MAIRPGPLEQTVGRIPYTNDAVLSAIFQKKSCTMQYNFPGYRNYGRLGQNSGLGIIRKNTLLARLSGSPFKYRPLVVVRLLSSGVGPAFTVASADVDKLFTSVDATELIRVWDGSAEAFMSSGNDQARWIVTATSTTITLNAALTTSVQANADYMIVGTGMERMREIVILDREIDLSVTAKPRAIEMDIVVSCLYGCRLNTQYLENWQDFPTTLKDNIRDKCQRLIFDVL